MGITCPTHHTVAHISTAYSYDPRGRCLGHIPATHLQHLHHMYHTTQHHQPHLWPTHSAGTFEEDIAALFHRYRDTTLQALQPTLLHALSMAHTTHWHTSPLTLTLPHQHYTHHPADALFGAQHDPYTGPWLGHTLVYTLPTHSATTKAIHWALTSALMAEARQVPSHTPIIAPYHPTANYHLTHPWVQITGTVAGGKELYHSPPLWTGGKITYPSTPTHPHLILTIINPTAYEQGQDTLPTLYTQLQDVLEALPTNHAFRNMRAPHLHPTWSIHTPCMTPPHLPYREKQL